MRKSLYISPSVLDFALTVYSSQNLCFVASSFCRSVILLLRRSVAPLLCRSVAPLLCRSIALLLCQSVAPSLRHSVATSLRRSVALLLCRSSLRCSFAPSIAPYTSSSELHDIKRTPRENTTLAFLLLILQNPRH